jgi:hypothetical protein
MPMRRLFRRETGEQEMTDPWLALADRIDPATQIRPELATPVTLAAHLDPHGYRTRPHLTLIGRELAALERHEHTRLIINTPPQVGKSTTAVEWFSFWWLCHHPTARIVIGSYGDDLAIRGGAKIKEYIDRYGATYGLHLKYGSRRMRDWELTSGGGVRSRGIGSGITGFSADLLIIDDPVKSREMADSLKNRDRVWNWYSADLLSRQQPGLRVLLVQTPWHPDDLRARVLQQDGDLADGGKWRTVVMPALAGPDDPLGRAPGEPLPHPSDEITEGDTGALLAHWLSIRATVAVRDWQSLWQCDPKPPEGTLLSWALLRERRWYEPGRGGVSEAKTIAVAVDPSGGGRDTAGIIGGYLGVDDRLHYTHDRSGVMSAEAWGRAACILAREIGADRIIYEQNYGGDQVKLVIRTSWDALSREYPDLYGPVCPRLVPVVARRGKMLRAEPIAQQWTEGRAGTAAYLPDLESEWATHLPGSLDSPGRLDASVHMAWELLPVPRSGQPSMDGAQSLVDTNLLPWAGRR